MKFILLVTAIALAQGASVKRSVGVSFGPQNCVSLSRSAGGSCVLTTSCEGFDTSATEFAFDCIGTGDVVRHSFGVGGFESSEEFDTEVKCGRCASAFPAAPVKKVQADLKPAPVLVMPKSEPAPEAPPAPVASKHQEVAAGAIVLNSKASTKVQGQAQAWPFSGSASSKPKGESAESFGKQNAVVRYGPDGCVSTWRSSEGHCIMRTDCVQSPPLMAYEFGLVCVDKNGSPVKHLFGKDSFDPKETFDTLIKCDRCLGLEAIPDTVALAGEVASMAKDVDNLKDVMKNISINVNMLNQKIFPQSPAPAAAGPAPAPAAPAKPAKFMVHGAVSHHKHHRGNLRRSHRKHHRRHRREEDDDDDDYDQDDDRREDRDDSEQRDDDNSAEEPKTEAVDAINAAAVQMQQAQASQAAVQAQVRYIPMNTVSTANAQISTASAPYDDNEDEDGSDED